MSIANIAAVVLAAGQSKRMGIPKLTLPWGGSTVIGRVIETLREAGIERIRVVTGETNEFLESTLDGMGIEVATNARFETGEMLSSLQVGLNSLPENVEAALVVIGDQPQMEIDVVKMVVERYLTARASLVIPSYQMRRGHPWLVGQSMWRDIIALKPPATLRDFINSHAVMVDYVVVDTPSILKDLDTPQDYERERPNLPPET